jgi:acyl-coenzyme A synthetase/AMP-(fatty) acid ligase
MQPFDSFAKLERTPESPSPLLPILPSDSARAILWSEGNPITVGEIGACVSALLNTLPIATHDHVTPTHVPAASMINLCEDRRNFLIAYAAALMAGHTTQLPASRASAVVAELVAASARSYCIDDVQVCKAFAGTSSATPMSTLLRDGAGGNLVAMIAHTSGSTGRSKNFPKTWAGISAITERNADAIRNAFTLPLDGPMPWIVATVPPQHMYGMEFSVMLPLRGGMGVHCSRPLFPADVAKALADVPAPRILVTTPFHLRVLVDSAVALPPLAGVISATAPLDQSLAKQVEQRFGTSLFEMFGSTETCIFATRRTAQESTWRPYDGVEITPRPNGVLVDAPWIGESMLLQDIVEMQANGGFVIRGRNADFVDVAGKRASLAELTRRLLAIPGVRDAVVFPPEQVSSAPASRVAALVVAPGLDATAVLQHLSEYVDPAFLPRPLLFVDKLPRTETGKLPREQLLARLRKALGNI